jgi:hypothetical protein
MHILVYSEEPQNRSVLAPKHVPGGRGGRGDTFPFILLALCRPQIMPLSIDMLYYPETADRRLRGSVNRLLLILAFLVVAHQGFARGSPAQVGADQPYTVE